MFGAPIFHTTAYKSLYSGSVVLRRNGQWSNDVDEKPGVNVSNNSPLEKGKSSREIRLSTGGVHDPDDPEAQREIGCMQELIAWNNPFSVSLAVQA